MSNKRLIASLAPSCESNLNYNDCKTKRAPFNFINLLATILRSKIPKF